MLDPKNRISTPSSAVVRLLQRFGPKNINPDDVTSEFRDFKAFPADHLPQEYSSLEEFWVLVGKILQPAAADARRFAHLSNFCKTLLVLPHSTADPERLFSMIGKIDTSQRSSLLPFTSKYCL